ncbi:hypothetical protein ACIRNI_04330 [Streptomyces sp. NPDC093546]|uniref:hypothetical protein n=1 Tax=Streptomyces sp. NPDC093546 TaxID=3366040 RepID=UPI0037F40CE2
MHMTALKVERIAAHTEDPAGAERAAHSLILEILSNASHSIRRAGNLQHSYVTPHANGFAVALFFNSARPTEALRQTRAISEVISAKLPESAGPWRVHYRSQPIHPYML